jgi:hypothetical protein
MVRFCSLLAILALAFCQPVALLAENRSSAAALDSITRSELQRHVEVLADDTFEGREAGARGGHAAAGYIAKLLQQFEMQPAGDRGSYYQGFNGSCRNILALLEGCDPEVKQEVIMVGAHYDHVGYGTQRNSYGPWGYIHNGADDNASGVAGLLELGQALSQLPQPPRRTILLAFWDGEEKGLLGSKHWVQAPTISLSRLKCCLNVDMIGRLTERRVEVYGSRSCAGLRQTVSVANATGLDLDFTWQMRDDSDHWPFFSQNIPILMLHTGLHRDYHRPSDDAEHINVAGLEEVSRLMFQTTLALANADQLGKFRQESRRETEDVRRNLDRPAAGPAARLGMTWKKQTVDDVLALHVLTINRGSAAEQAGLRIGDIVRRLNGEPITDDGLFRRQVLASSKPLEFLTERPGEAERTITVKLSGTPIRTGLTTRQDAAEPGVMIVNHVVYGSPAALAGIQVGDRIDAVNDQPLTGASEFYRQLDEANAALSLRVERRGRLQQATLALIPR